MHPESANLILIETEHNAYTEETKKQRRVQMAKVSSEICNMLGIELLQRLLKTFFLSKINILIFVF